MIYHLDCKYFRGEVPCTPHKEYNVHCDDCTYYQRKKGIILIIKLGAIGDVIRTTPLLERLWKDYPDFEIWWLTKSPEILPSGIERILTFDNESLLVLNASYFHIIINLDKDAYACGLTSILQADTKIGFGLVNGKPSPIDENARQKFLTGLFDDVSLANQKSYPEEMFEICGWEYNGEEYLIKEPVKKKWNLKSDGKKIIGLNTGCGSRWISRLWKSGYWIELIGLLQLNGYYPLILGGEQEHQSNEKLSAATRACYKGYFSLGDFVSLMNECDVVITAVTMALHIAIALKKQVVLFNNIFNPHEFELYSRGEILQPEKPCKCFFSPKCKNDEYFCMDTLYPEKVLESVLRLTTK